MEEIGKSLSNNSVGNEVSITKKKQIKKDPSNITYQAWAIEGTNRDFSR